ncbi:unnamed protein product [Leptosia nina]|uniref:C3H1-type domain-containing protein n=1 Tax=Leptosia nina TaxID=320188 RepID=A0AAV1JIR2_9NEOP
MQVISRNFSIIILGLASLLRADEDAKIEATETKTEGSEVAEGRTVASYDYSFIELAVSPKSGNTNEDAVSTVKDDGILTIDDIIKYSESNNLYKNENTLRRFTAYLRDPSGDEVYKPAQLNIDSKDTNQEKSAKEKEKEAEESPTEKVTSSDETRNPHDNETTSEESKLSTEKAQNVVETKLSQEREQNELESKMSSEKDKHVEETKTTQPINNETSRKAENKEGTPYTKTPTTVKTTTKTKRRTTSIPKKLSSVDDLDDLLYPYEIGKFRKNYDDDEDYSSSNEQEQPEVDVLETRFNRRMFDSVPIIDTKGRTQTVDISVPTLQTITTPRPFTASRAPVTSNTFFPSLILTTRAPILSTTTLRSFSVPQYIYNKPTTVLQNVTPLPNNSPNRWTRPQEISNIIPNGFVNSQENGHLRLTNSRETLTDTFSHAQEVLNYQHRFVNPQEILNNPIRTSHPQEMLNNPTRMRHPQELHNPYLHPRRYFSPITNRWTSQEMFDIPTRFLPSQDMINVPNRWRPSEEILDSTEYQTIDAPEDSADANAYPYVPPHRNKMTDSSIHYQNAPSTEHEIRPVGVQVAEPTLNPSLNLPDPNMNPVLRKLAQASHIPQTPQYMPIYLDFFRYPEIILPDNMGKRYHCDYCDKSMVATPSIIRTHRKGSVHQKLVNDHYKQYKDPETILREESGKKPCSRFATGQCPFGSICRYSHYTPQELSVLKNYVAQKSMQEIEQPQPQSLGDLYEKLITDTSTKVEMEKNESVLYDTNGLAHIMPWSYNPMFDKYGENLPPSLRRLQAENFAAANITQWG